MKKIYWQMTLLLTACFIFLFFDSVSVTAASAEKDTLQIEYLDVGQGDAALIQCDGHSLLIDGGSSASSSLIYSVLKERNINNLDYIIATHPDADHIGGLSGALNYAKVETCYSPVLEDDSEVFANLLKFAKRRGKDLTVPKAGSTFKLGSAKGIFIAPQKASDGSNNDSLVVRIIYGKTSFIFMGDAEGKEEAEIIRRWNYIKSDVIKVGHHGSSSSTSAELLEKVNPSYAIISVGKDNSYGHPTEETLERLKKANIEVYRTDLQGTIKIVSDGVKLTITTESKKQSNDITRAAVVDIPSNTTYVLNKSNKKFHEINCKSVNQMKESNREFTTKTAEQLVEEGYTPCGNCKPYVILVQENPNPAPAADIERSLPAAQEAPAIVAEPEPVPAPAPAPAAAITYVLNTNSKKFHYPTCKSVNQMKAQNRQDVSMSREEVMAAGYKSCGNCHP